jgi:hypothetical protein
MSDYGIARLADLPRLVPEGDDDAEWTPIRHLLGIGAFGVNAWHGARAGEVVIEAHDEIPGSDCGCAGHEELYFVVEGRALFFVDGEEVNATPGTLIAVPPHVHRKAIAAADGTLVLAIGAARGEAFTPSPWERQALEKAGAEKLL